MNGAAQATRLHVYLGEGGVGKTTLAAGHALALARSGRRVALLGIDPARRLQSALGLPLGSEATPVTVGVDGGSLHAALLAPEATLRRWATNGLTRPDERERLLHNRLFAAVADRLATTTDVIAAARIAEWVAEDPSLTDFVVDTAPGRNGLDIFRRPTALVELLKGRLVRWLGGNPERGHLRARVLGSLAPLGGADMLAELVQLVSVAQAAIRPALSRLEHAEACLRAASTEIVLVTTVREQAIDAVASACAVLGETGLAPTAVVVNRTLPPSLATELALVDDASAIGADAADVIRYARGHLELQNRVLASAGRFAASVVEIAAASGLDTDARLEVLATVGDQLRRGLDARAG